MQLKSIFGALCLSFAACIWGGMFVVVKTIVGEIPPIQLVWLRYLIAVVVLGLIAWQQHLTWHWDWPNLRLMILAGLVGDTLSIVLQETGTWLASAQLGAVITTATPTAMVLFGWPLLHRRPHRSHWVSLALATSGVIAIVGVQVTGRHVGLGAGCLLLAGLTWALMSVLIQLIDQRYSPLQVTLLAALVAVICLTPVVIWQAPILTHIAWTRLHVWGESPVSGSRLDRTGLLTLESGVTTSAQPLIRFVFPVATRGGRFTGLVAIRRAPFVRLRHRIFVNSRQYLGGEPV